MDKKGLTRRQFVKGVAYMAPVIVTMSVVPSLASAGSGYTGVEYYKPQRHNHKPKGY